MGNGNTLGCTWTKKILISTDGLEKKKEIKSFVYTLFVKN